MEKISDCFKVELPQGAIYLGKSDVNRSVGYLELNPHTSLTLHNRPVKEILTQIEGSTSIVKYDENGKLNEFVLNEGDTHTIEPAGTWHIHVNPFNNKSLIYWDFPGDITEIIDNIRNK